LGSNILSFISNASINVCDFYGLSPADMLWPSPIEIGLQAWWDLIIGFHSEEGCKIVEDETTPEKAHGNSKSMDGEICTDSIEDGDFYFWCSSWIEGPETPPIISNLKIYSHAGNAVRTWTEYRHETSSCKQDCECECRPGDWIWNCGPTVIRTIGRNQEYKCWRVFELNGKYPRKTPPWFPIAI